MLTEKLVYPTEGEKLGTISGCDFAWQLRATRKTKRAGGKIE